MTATEEACVEGSPKLSFRSYFALIPVFNKRKESTAEKNIIKIIHKSSICKSSPVLKTLLIENVRICCIVVESSGKQSVKILYASVPLLFALISKANPKLKRFLKNENISSCLKILQESNFDSVLDNAYHTTVIIHRGIKKIYPTVCVTMLKDSLLFSEKSLLYLLKLILHVLKSTVDFLCDNITPVFQYLCHQNYALAAYIADIFPKLIAAVIKYSVIATFNVQKATIFIFQLFRKILLCFNHILNHFYADSMLSDSLKKLCLFLKLSLAYIRSTDACGHIESILLHMFEITKPYVWKYLQKFFEVMKGFIRTSLPVLKKGIEYAVKESIPFLRKCIEDNYEAILSTCISMKYFLKENSKYLKPFCCYTCRFMHSLISYLYKTLQDSLPHIIRFSSNATIYFTACLTSILKNCIYAFHTVYSKLFFALKSQKGLLCHLTKTAFKILKTVYNIFLELHPYILSIFRIIFSELIRLIHISSPTLLACVYEVNSSVYFASNELVAKSCVAVKRITPSFYCSLKTVVPHTARAANAVIKSSKNSMVIVFPAILKGVLAIRPEVNECIVVLFSDGNKACLEVIGVSYSATCHLKNAARSVSTNLPVVYKAIYEVLKTTSCAAVEVSVTSINAKSRMLKDLRKAHEVVHTSFVLAEQEVAAAYMEFILEMNSIMPHSKTSVSSESKTFKHVINYLFKFCSNHSDKLLTLFKSIFNLLDTLVGESTAYSTQIFKALLRAASYLIFFSYSMNINILKANMPEMEVLLSSAQKLLARVFSNTKCITSSIHQYLGDHLSTNTANISSKVAHYISLSISKIWCVFKSNVHTTWLEACEMAPVVWVMIEYTASLFWNFIIENIPGAWMAWKITCFEIWKLIYDFSPYIWYYSSSIIPVLWSSGRNVTKHNWMMFINASGFMWNHSASLSSEYWMLSKIYVPKMWFTGCEETKKSWNMTCCLIENCWNFTVESCCSSWNFLHRSVAKSWRRSLVFTKNAYCMFTTTGSVLQKSFCVYSNSKNYVYVMMLEARPHISNFALNSIRVPKLSKILPVFRKGRANSDDSSAHCSKKKPGFKCNIKRCALAVVDSLPCTGKLLDYEIFMSSKFFCRNHKKL